MTRTASTCPYCGVGCGVIAETSGGRTRIMGDPDHPANYGALCSKGITLGQTLGLEGRLLRPEIDGMTADWDSALDLIAERFRDVIARKGPDAVAFYVSGQILTEDYYVANKLMKGFIGSANIDTNSRLCMASSVAGHRRGFGGDIVPGSYEDFDEADLVLLVGSNAAHCHPVLFRRMLAARAARGTKLIAIDPRRSVTAGAADQHLALAPGTDSALFAGLLVYLADHGHLDPAYLDAHVAGFEVALAAARTAVPTLSAAAAATGVPTAELLACFRAVAGTERWVTAYSQGVNQSSNGTDTVNAILNCHFATGRIGRPGMGPFSLTGQPNAMGGREVGGLANQLAAHMAIEDAAARDRVQRFWQSPTIASTPGLKAVDLFDEIHHGRVEAVWIVGTNPAVSLPEAGRVRAALARCPFVVVSDVMAATDTLPFADVRLPALAWGEKAGTVTNSERRISRQRAFRPAPGEAKPDWWAFAAVGQRMGFGQAFAYDGPDEVFREHAALSGFENDGARGFDIGGLKDLDAAGYEALAPVQWPLGQARLFAAGGFKTPDGKARAVAVTPGTPRKPPSTEYPLVLITGRLRDQWHTMTRTGAVVQLAAQHPESFVAVAPSDLGAIPTGALVRVISPWGGITVPVRRDPDQTPGQVFVPIHWTDQMTSNGVVGRVVNPFVDPVSGQPELKHTAVRLDPVAVDWYGEVLARRPLDLDAVYWSRRPVEGGTSHRIAWTGGPERIATELARTLGAEVIALTDHARAKGRWALFDTAGLAAIVTAERSWPALIDPNLLTVSADQRHAVLARPLASPSPIICACRSVDRTAIEAAVAQGADTVAAIGDLTGAGTACGSCCSEVERVRTDVRLPAVA